MTFSPRRRNGTTQGLKRSGMIQEIFSFMDEHHIKPLIGATYDFEHIKDACIALDSGKVNGKIVVEV